MAKSRNPSLGQVSDFDIRLLRIFKTIVECGSFSAAESTLGLSRSAISLHMGDLEKRLGMRLCQRGRAGFALTDEGREVIARPRPCWRRWRVPRRGQRPAPAPARRTQHRHHQQPGDPTSDAHHPRPQRAQGAGTAGADQHRHDHPNEIELGVLDGHLHVGVVPLISPLSGLEYLPLYDEHAQLCSRGHALFERADGDIAVDEVLAADAVAPSYRLPAEAQARHQELNNSASASDREGMAFLILTGNFIGYLPSHYAADWVAAGMLRPLLPERFHYAIALTIVTRKGRRPNLVLERFLEAVAVS